MTDDSEKTEEITIDDRDEKALRQAEDAYAEARQELEEQYQQRMNIIQSKFNGAIAHVREAYDVPEGWEFSIDDDFVGFTPSEGSE